LALMLALVLAKLALLAPAWVLVLARPQLALVLELELGQVLVHQHNRPLCSLRS